METVEIPVLERKLRQGRGTRGHDVWGVQDRQGGWEGELITVTYADILKGVLSHSYEWVQGAHHRAPFGGPWDDALGSF